MARNNGLQQYWNGYRLAKYDVFECGEDFAWSQYWYGLNGKTLAFCNGYKHYLDYLDNLKAKRKAR